MYVVSKENVDIAEMNGALIEIEQEKKKSSGHQSMIFFFIDFLREFSRRHGGRQYIFFPKRKLPSRRTLRSI